MIRVLVDACLLVKGNVSNVLFDLGRAGLISLHWTPEIGTQFIKNWAERRVEGEIKRRSDSSEPLLTPGEKSSLEAASRNKASVRLGKFELMAPEWRIPGWNVAAVRAAHSKSSLGVGKRGGTGVHSGDYEVALAAIRLAEIFPGDDIWLATENIHHLPPAVLQPFNVWSLHQGLLLETLYASSPGKVRNSLETTLADTGKNGNAKLEKIDMIGILSNPQEFFSHALATSLSKAWGINMPTNGAAFVKKNKIRNAEEDGPAPAP